MSSTFSREQVGFILLILMKFGKAEDGQAAVACGRVGSLASNPEVLVKVAEGLLWAENGPIFLDNEE